MKSEALISQNRTLIPQCFIARSFFSRFLGLMGKKSIAENSAICFPHCNSIHTFFMRFPIDVIFISEQGEIVEIKSEFRPWKLTFPKRNFKHVIELAPGSAKKLKMELGQKITLKGVTV